MLAHHLKRGPMSKSRAPSKFSQIAIFAAQKRIQLPFDRANQGRSRGNGPSHFFVHFRLLPPAASHRQHFGYLPSWVDGTSGGDRAGQSPSSPFVSLAHPSQPSGFALILATLFATFLSIFSIFVSLEIHLFWLLPIFIRSFGHSQFSSFQIRPTPSKFSFSPNTSSFVQFQSSVPSTAGHLQFPFFLSFFQQSKLARNFILTHFLPCAFFYFKRAFPPPSSGFVGPRPTLLLPFPIPSNSTLSVPNKHNPFPFYRYPFFLNPFLPPFLHPDVPHFLRISRLIAPQSAIHSRTFQPTTMIGMGVFCHPFCLRKISFWIISKCQYSLIPSVIHSFPQFHISSLFLSPMSSSPSSIGQTSFPIILFCSLRVTQSQAVHLGPIKIRLFPHNFPSTQTALSTPQNPSKSSHSRTTPTTLTPISPIGSSRKWLSAKMSPSLLFAVPLMPSAAVSSSS